MLVKSLIYLYNNNNMVDINLFDKGTIARCQGYITKYYGVSLPRNSIHNPDEIINNNTSQLAWTHASIPTYIWCKAYNEKHNNSVGGRGSKRSGSKHRGSKHRGSKHRGSKRGGSKCSRSNRGGSKRGGSKCSRSKRGGSKRGGSRIAVANIEGH